MMLELYQCIVKIILFSYKLFKRSLSKGGKVKFGSFFS